MQDSAIMADFDDPLLSSSSIDILSLDDVSSLAPIGTPLGLRSIVDKGDTVVFLPFLSTLSVFDNNLLILDVETNTFAFEFGRIS